MSMKRRKRRLWDDDEKCRIVGQTRVPGVSVSQVARRYDVNANLVDVVASAPPAPYVTPSA